MYHMFIWHFCACNMSRFFIPINSDIIEVVAFWVCWWTLSLLKSSPRLAWCTFMAIKWRVQIGAIVTTFVWASIVSCFFKCVKWQRSTDSEKGCWNKHKGHLKVTSSWIFFALLWFWVWYLDRCVLSALSILNVLMQWPWTHRSELTFEKWLCCRLQCLNKSVLVVKEVEHNIHCQTMFVSTTCKHK